MTRPAPPLKIGIVSNPASQQNKRGLNGINEVLAANPEVVHATLGDISELREVLAEFARREVGLVVVNGGDGSVQATMTELLNNGHFERPPPLAVLPRGMTNMIAADVGLKGRPEKSLSRLIERVAAGEPLERVTRAVLSVDYAPDLPPIHGMFLGTAAFYRGTLLARAKVHSLGIERSMAVGLSLGLFLAQALLRPNGANALVRGDPMSIELDGDRTPERNYLIVLATTLDRLTLGLMPFWGSGGGRLRYTSVSYPPTRFARALIPLLRGRPRPWMTENGYVSRAAERVSLRLSCPIMFDGEMLTPRPGVPVVLSADREIGFLRC